MPTNAEIIAWLAEGGHPVQQEVAALRTLRDQIAADAPERPWADTVVNAVENVLSLAASYRNQLQLKDDAAFERERMRQRGLAALRELEAHAQVQSRPAVLNRVQAGIAAIERRGVE